MGRVFHFAPLAHLSTKAPPAPEGEKSGPGLAILQFSVQFSAVRKLQNCRYREVTIRRLSPASRAQHVLITDPGVCSLRSRHPRLYAVVRFAHFV